MEKEELIDYLENVKNAYEARLERFKESKEYPEDSVDYFFGLGQICAVRDIISDLKNDFDLIQWINGKD